MHPERHQNALALPFHKPGTNKDFAITFVASESLRRHLILGTYMELRPKNLFKDLSKLAH